MFNCWGRPSVTIFCSVGRLSPAATVPFLELQSRLSSSVGGLSFEGEARGLSFDSSSLTLMSAAYWLEDEDEFSIKLCRLPFKSVSLRLPARLAFFLSSCYRLKTDFCEP